MIKNNVVDFLAFMWTHVHICYVLSSVHLSSVCHLMFVHSTTQLVEIVGTVSAPFGTLAICW